MYIVTRESAQQRFRIVDQFPTTVHREIKISRIPHYRPDAKSNRLPPVPNADNLTNNANFRPRICARPKPRLRRRIRGSREHEPGSLSAAMSPPAWCLEEAKLRSCCCLWLCLPSPRSRLFSCLRSRSSRRTHSRRVGPGAREQHRWKFQLHWLVGSLGGGWTCFLP